MRAVITVRLFSTVCSRSVKGANGSPSLSSSSSARFTVDINPDTKPDLVGDAQTLEGIPNNKFNRWRCDPPYSQNTAQKMYGTGLPATAELLRTGARVCKVSSLLFLLTWTAKLPMVPKRSQKNWLGCNYYFTK
jgi:hypothetical protein